VRKSFQIVIIFLWLFPVVVFATCQSNKIFNFPKPILFKHPETIERRKKVIEGWFRQSTIKMVLPLELVELMEKHIAVDEIDFFFSLNEKISSINDQIREINTVNNSPLFIIIDEISNNHNCEEFCSYFSDLNKINKSLYIHFGFFDSKDIIERCKDFDSSLFGVNTKIIDFNKKIAIGEKRKKKQENSFCRCM